MKKIKWAVAAALLMSGQAWSATGNDLISWVPSYERDAMTWESGMLLGYVSGASNMLNGVVFCAPKATNGQNTAIVIKFLKNNPERWGEDATSLVYDALTNSYPKCKKA
ncbi:Rap1a/Tai family immunity protein [Pseudomonas corrugata]|uniref:Rap1a/Tai family immunity protein n=1 Tax=Pseudomonas corrugata TaxID=47879 RepID=UPI0028C3ED0C|nr:Rap1a/Tai family immunity protein [Pseudomonas corrugata]MDU9039965.1 Rap1a/Tai family immunity protein [Pseudomonas corrugata]